MIETARLRLRPGLDRDVKGLVAAMNDWSIAQWLIRPPYPYSEDDARRFIQWTLPKDGVGLGGTHVVADRHTDELLGVVSLESAGERAELGYWLRRDAQRRGYMREAVSALLRDAAGKLGPMTVFATTDPDNAASQAVLLAVGFKEIGVEARTVASRRSRPFHVLYEAPLGAYQ